MQAIHSIHGFIQNLYNYASADTDAYRAHMLSDTLLVPRLILPYLDKCVRQAAALENSSVFESDSPVTEGLETPALAQGIASSLRTLVSSSTHTCKSRV
jgi:hypothetical protein